MLQSFAVTKSDQTITFGPIADQTPSPTPLTVSATTSSGLAVTFTTTTPLVCAAGGTNGTTITYLAVGTCTVEADQAGSSAYNAAPAVLESFTISKADQTITFLALVDVTFPSGPLSIEASSTSGLPVIFTTSTPLVCTAGGSNGAEITLVAPGTCTVAANQPGNDLVQRGAGGGARLRRRLDAADHHLPARSPT